MVFSDTFSPWFSVTLRMVSHCCQCSLNAFLHYKFTTMWLCLDTMAVAPTGVEQWWWTWRAPLARKRDAATRAVSITGEKAGVPPHVPSASLAREQGCRQSAAGITGERAGMLLKCRWHHWRVSVMPRAASISTTLSFTTKSWEKRSWWTFLLSTQNHLVISLLSD